MKTSQNVELNQLQKLTNFTLVTVLKICSTAAEFFFPYQWQSYLYNESERYNFKIHAIVDFIMHHLNQMKYIDTEHASQEWYSISDLYTDNYVIKVTISFEEITENCMYSSFLVEVLCPRKKRSFPSFSDSKSNLQQAYVFKGTAITP